MVVRPMLLVPPLSPGAIGILLADLFDITLILPRVVFPVIVENPSLSSIGRNTIRQAAIK